MSTSAISIVKLGAIAPDQYIPDMRTHPVWHGFTSYQSNGTFTEWSNYISAYIYITEIAAAVETGSNPKTVANSVTINSTAINNIRKIFQDNSAGIIKYSVDSNGVEIGTQNKSWSTVLGNATVSNRNKSLFIYGMALYTVSDMYAHSTNAPDGTYINHSLGADTTTYYENRYDCAELMIRYLIAHIKRAEPALLSDYYNVANSSIYNDTFTINRLVKFVKEVDLSYYNTNQTVFNTMSTQTY